MAPSPLGLYRREAFNSATTSNELREQFIRPGDVFSILLLLGPDVIAQALGQLAGGALTPVTFSFGWVAYAVSALMSVGGENKLMPPATDVPGVVVINGKNGYVRSNNSWLIGRVMRDYEKWMHEDTKRRLQQNKIDKLDQDKNKLLAKNKNVEANALQLPTRAGLCVAVYQPSKEHVAGVPIKDGIYYSGLFTAVIQLGIAAVPCGLFGDWGILMVTACGITLAFLSGSLPQWGKEKWACRRNATKDVILSQGNGSQHAVIVLGNEKGLDLEDLAASATNDDASNSVLTRWATVSLAILWTFLLIAAAGLKENAWFLLAVGGIGMLQNITVASFERHPQALGIHLTFVTAIGHHKVMQTLYEVESKYPGLGASMLPTFFPGDLRQDEQNEWKRFATLRGAVP